MGTVAFVVIVRKEERIGAILGPHVVELRSIPQRLVGDLWHSGWGRLLWLCCTYDLDGWESRHSCRPSIWMLAYQVSICPTYSLHRRLLTMGSDAQS